MDSEDINNITGVIVLFINNLLVYNLMLHKNDTQEFLLNQPVKGYQRCRFTWWALKAQFCTRSEYSGEVYKQPIIVHTKTTYCR